MPKERGGRRKGGHEICPGYADDNGIWNNGFYCPRWGGPTDQYCCGDATRRFCCPKPKTTEAPEVVSYIPILIGISVTLFVLAAVLFFTCCFCPCCPGYRKRQKRLQKAAQQQSHDLPDIAVQVSGQPLPSSRSSSPGPGPAGSPGGRYDPSSRGGGGASGCAAAHLHTPTHANSDVLHCGCQWSPALPRSPMSDLDSIMKQLYGDSANSWSELEPVLEYPADKPPPYTEHDMHKLGIKNPHKSGGRDKSGAGSDSEGSERAGCKTLGRRFKERKDTQAAELSKVTRAISDPSQLSMKSFRPMLLRPGGRDHVDAKRDSGVLVEEVESMLGDPEPPFVLHGVKGLPQMPRYNSRGSLDVDPPSMSSSMHSQQLREHLS